jgi:L-amino acid ligase C-terminal domain 2
MPPVSTSPSASCGRPWARKYFPRSALSWRRNGPARCSAIWFAAAPVAGVLAVVSGLDEAGKAEGVTEVKLLARPGGTIGPLESSDSRVAYMRAVGRTADLAVKCRPKSHGAARIPFAGARGERADGVTPRIVGYIWRRGEGKALVARKASTQLEPTRGKSRCLAGHPVHSIQSVRDVGPPTGSTRADRVTRSA